MSSSTRSLKIGIIGFGPFAQFLAKTMIKQGHLINATSRSDYSQISGYLGVHFFRDMEEFMRLEHDVILICTSIMSLSEVVKSIPFHCLQRQTLFADVLSVKEHPKQVLLQEVPEDSDLVCTHPMFGPESGKHGWNNLTFMYERVRVRDDSLCSSFLKIFEGEGCKMLEITCEEHDRLAAESQFVAHTIGRYKLLIPGTPYIGSIMKRKLQVSMWAGQTSWVTGHNGILSEMQITNTPIDTKGFEKLVQVVCPSLHYNGVHHIKVAINRKSIEYAKQLTLDSHLQKESTENDSFDLYSGLFIHNRFAKQQMKSLESALQRVKGSLETRMNQQDGKKIS